MDRRAVVFPDKGAASKVWQNLTGEAPKALKETPVIAIDPLPAPNHYDRSKTLP
jgi:hypothetical protein